jgi:hypothetical protein
MCSHETTLHLLTECSYTEATWNLVATTFGLPHFNVMSLRGDPTSWMKYLLRTGSKKEQRKMVGILFIFWWNIWKERNNQFSKMLQDHQQCCSLLSKRTSIINTQSSLWPDHPLFFVDVYAAYKDAAFGVV